MWLVDVLFSVGTPAEEAGWGAMIDLLRATYPDWNGIPLRPRQSVDLMLGVIDKATPKESGGCVSQYGDKRWI